MDDYDYSFAIVGDTQIINYYNPDDFSNIYGWIVDNAESKKIVHTIGLGDITDKDSADEWARARESFDELEAAGNTYTS